MEENPGVELPENARTLELAENARTSSVLLLLPESLEAAGEYGGLAVAVDIIGDGKAVDDPYMDDLKVGTAGENAE